MSAARLLSVSLLLASAPLVHAEVKDSSPMGFTVENSRVVPVEPQAAWDALTDKVHLWWPKDHTWWGKDGRLTIRPRVGGCFCELFDKHQAQHMTVAFVDPPKTLRMVGGLGPLQGMGLNGALEFRLEPVGEGSTKVTLWYRAGGYTPDDMSKFAPTVDQVQAQQLGGLATFLGAKDAPAS